MQDSLEQARRYVYGQGPARLGDAAKYVRPARTISLGLVFGQLAGKSAAHRDAATSAASKAGAREGATV